jgi:hypothetical protein
VVFVVARLAGARGVSRRAVVVTTGLLATYFILRFGVLGIGAPEVGERATGFGFGRIEPDEIRARFVETGRLWYFYVYNVASALISSALWDPSNGRWEVTERLVNGRLDRTSAAYLVAALGAFVLLIRFLVVRWSAWRSRQFEWSDRVVLVFGAVAVGNAAISYSYVKDEVMSTAGVFYALAVFVVTRDALASWGRSSHRAVATAICSLALCVVGAAWTVRATSVPYQMLRIGAADRYEWAHVDEWLEEQGIAVSTLEGAELLEALRAEATRTAPISRRFVPRQLELWVTPQ